MNMNKSSDNELKYHVIKMCIEGLIIMTLRTRDEKSNALFQVYKPNKFWLL